jgi:hypothetical protein
MTIVILLLLAFAGAGVFMAKNANRLAEMSKRGKANKHSK